MDGELPAAELPFTLDKAATYHLNAYWTPRANDMNDVMMCANLQQS